MYPSPRDKQRKNRLASVGRRDRIKTNDDGSVDLYFGPKEPKGQRVELVPNQSCEGFFVMFRCYGAEREFYLSFCKLA